MAEGAPVSPTTERNPRFYRLDLRLQNRLFVTLPGQPSAAGLSVVLFLARHAVASAQLRTVQ